MQIVMTDMQQAKTPSSFDREYDLKYIGKTGNVFHQKDIERAIMFGRQFDPDLVNAKTPKALGIDWCTGCRYCLYRLVQNTK